MASEALKYLEETTTLPAPELAKSDPEAWAKASRQRLEADYQQIVTILREIDREIDSNLFAPPGTRLVFDQDTPPPRWTRDTSINDRVVRIVGGSRVHGGSWTISGLSSPAHQHDLGNHTHTVASHVHSLQGHTHSMQGHTHNIVGSGTSILGAASGGVTVAGGLLRMIAPDGESRDIASATTSGPSTGSTGGPSVADTGAASPGTGGPSPNLTGLTAASVVSDGSWRPLSRDMIVAVKD